MQNPPSICLLYVTPEKLMSSSRLEVTLQHLYQLKRLGRFVVDESHCVSQWGHDVRPDYAALLQLRSTFPGIPVSALTATANQRVQRDIVGLLGMQAHNTKWFSTSFNRPNLQYKVWSKGQHLSESLADIAVLLRGKFAAQSGIIYCLSRKECELAAETLSQCGLQAAPYHAGLADALRAETQTRWSQGHLQVVCATIAFGMGIDKANVRFVFHLSLPKSIEGYYQESGRAGRLG